MRTCREHAELVTLLDSSEHLEFLWNGSVLTVLLCLEALVCSNASPEAILMRSARRRGLLAQVQERLKCHSDFTQNLDRFLLRRLTAPIVG